VGVVSILHDQTERKRLERERAAQAEQLDRTFEGITDGLVIYDAQGHVLRTNTAARRILGVDVAQPLYATQSAHERTHLYAVRDEQGHPLAPEERPLIRVLRGQVEAGAETRNIQLRTLDGREVELTVGAAPLRDEEGRLVGAVTILQDQTERNRLAREQEAARTNELALREVNERLDTFVAMAAHDLRSPVGVSQMVVHRAQDLLRQAVTDVDSVEGSAASAEQKRAVTRAVQAVDAIAFNIDRLMRLVQQLLDVARVKEGTLVLQRQPVDLAELVRTCVDDQRLLTPSRAISVELPDAGRLPVRANVDPDRLNQVLSNYLVNAARYSPEDEPIEVCLEVVTLATGDAGAPAVRVEVRDHGPGIAPEDQATIWDQFQRAHSVQEAKGGLGLGLHIARTLIELHGGQVGVDSAVGDGSTFWFTLPLNPTPA
jgi:PAS domain S-box-containing protein